MAKSPRSPSQLRLGQAIRARRVQLGMPLATFATDLDIAISSLSKLENGLTPITFERLERIGQLLGVDVGFLLKEGSMAPPTNDGDSGAPIAAPNFGSRRTITRDGAEQAVEGGGYTLLFHATDLLEKRFQPLVAEVHCQTVQDYGPYTRHDGEEFNYVLCGTLEFHTDVYAPVTLKAGDSVYFDAEMGHAHIRAGDEPCRILSMITPRTARTVRNGVDAAIQITRADQHTANDGDEKMSGLRV